MFILPLHQFWDHCWGRSCVSSFLWMQETGLFLFLLHTCYLQESAMHLLLCGMVKDAPRISVSYVLPCWPCLGTTWHFSQQINEWGLFLGSSIGGSLTYTQWYKLGQRFLTKDQRERNHQPVISNHALTPLQGSEGAGLFWKPQVIWLKAGQ